MSDPRDNAATPRLIAVAVLGVVLILPPMLARFDEDRLVLGVPLLWLYLFGVWALLIALTALVVARCGRKGK